VTVKKAEDYAAHLEFVGQSLEHVLSENEVAKDLWKRFYYLQELYVKGVKGKVSLLWRLSIRILFD
jgi:hypothetical protein